MNYRAAAVAAGAGAVSAVVLWASFELLVLTDSLSESVAGRGAARLVVAADVVAVLLLVPALIVLGAALLARGLGAGWGRAWLTATVAFVLVPFLGLPDGGALYPTAAVPVGEESILSSVLSPVSVSVLLVLAARRIPRKGKLIVVLIAALFILAQIPIRFGVPFESVEGYTGVLWMASLASLALLPAVAALFIPREHPGA